MRPLRHLFDVEGAHGEARRRGPCDAVEVGRRRGRRGGDVDGGSDGRGGEVGFVCIF